MKHIISNSTSLSRKFLETVKQKHTQRCQNVLGMLKYRKGHAVAQLVEALSYRPEGRGFDSRWCHWNFSLT